jgi:hypothetical protein
MNQNKLGPVLLLMICMLSVSGTSQVRGAETTSVSGTFDYSGLKKEMVIFQGVVDTTVRQLFQGPFPILGSTKGTYLPEYGAVFNLEVNLYQIRHISPFDLRPHTNQELNEAYNAMLKRVDTLKGTLIKVMGEHGPSLQQVKAEDNFTLVVHLFNAEDEAKRPCPSQMILKAKKSVLSDYRENKLSLADLTKKVEIVQF